MTVDLDEALSALRDALRERGYRGGFSIELNDPPSARTVAATLMNDGCGFPTVYSARIPDEYTVDFICSGVKFRSVRRPQ